jgi:hypothetical protein
MKYKPCCSKRCLLGRCEIRENGGCYCLCSLKDHENTLLSLLDGTSYRFENGIIYDPNRIPSPLGGFERKNAEELLERVRAKIKTYEVE